MKKTNSLKSIVQKVKTTKTKSFMDENDTTKALKQWEKELSQNESKSDLESLTKKKLISEIITLREYNSELRKLLAKKR